MNPLGPARIFWAVDPGKRGEGKVRPMIVMSRRVDLVRTGRVIAIVCSTEFSDPPGPAEIRLPSGPNSRSTTRLTRETVAVCDWTTEFDVASISETGGLVPAALMREICQRAGLVYPSER